MKPPITATQAMSHPAVFETVKSLGQMADKLYTKAGALTKERDALTKERDALTERVKALEADAERYQLLSNYLISDDCQHDDAIVAARTVDQLNAVIAAMKEPK